jgi:NADP-dependent 3-hydroxy acid dehydrogenase YdfG
MNTKVAIITGASSGMGAATAELLAKNGIRVMMAARREERLHQLWNEIISEGGEACYKVTFIYRHGSLGK